MSPTTSRPVVVGVDFSKDNASAVEYAAAIARRRGVPLHLVYAVDPQDAPHSYLAMTLPELREDAETALADQAAAVREDNPGLEVTTAFMSQSPADALVDASERASLVVVGSRGHGGFGQLLLGSVAWRVAARARGVVVLVRPGELIGQVARGPVLVGVDGSASSAAALDFALAEASSRGTGLVAVTVWTLLRPEGLSRGQDLAAVPDEWRQEMALEAERVLSELLAGTSERYPDVAVTRVVVHGLNVPESLLEVASAKEADLVVVGARGTHAAAELVLGAVGVQLSHHADRAVAVVHEA